MYVCQQCGYETAKWLGKCPNCGAWGSLVETVLEEPSIGSRHRSRSAKKADVKFLKDVPQKFLSRFSSKISELDRVLGGGFVPGQVVLLAGEPGIGKSTLLLQTADNMSSKKLNSIYVSGEESVNQIKIRAQRLSIKGDGLMLIDETNVDSIVESIESLHRKRQIGLVVIDSIQTLYTEDLSGLSGSVGQVRESASRLVRLAKYHQIPVCIVGHVTKIGTVAGPAVLAHIVDTVLWFEGEKETLLRVLRANKNRFGPTDEVGIFKMEAKGLVSQENPQELFLTNTKTQVSGSVVASVMEGTRPILVEIQSLVSPTKMAFPRRIVQGIDSRRLEMLIAVLQQRSGLNLGASDIFVNIVGGLNVKEPGVDLGICLSIASSYFGKSVPRGTVAVGEIGLLGEIREVLNQTKRIKDARRIGYKNVISSANYSYLSEVVRNIFAK